MEIIFSKSIYIYGQSLGAVRWMNKECKIKFLLNLFSARKAFSTWKDINLPPKNHSSETEDAKIDYISS